MHVPTLELECSFVPSHSNDPNLKLCLLAPAIAPAIAKQPGHAPYIASSPIRHIMDDTQNPEDTSAAPNDGTSEQGGLPSCDGCRHRKLKCSRDTPSCSKCQSLGGCSRHEFPLADDEITDSSCCTGIPCVYDMRKNKPGLKAGAIESLGKRIGKLGRGITLHMHRHCGMLLTDMRRCT